MSGEDIIIADLRVQLYEAREDTIEQAKTHTEEVADLRRQLDRMRERADEAEQRADICHHNHAAAIAAVRDENERLRAAIDRRPDISAEDAELFSRTSHAVSQTIEDRIPGYADAMSRIASALQGHAEKAVKS